MIPAALGLTLATAMPKPDFSARAADWRMGAVVYQIMPDRFVPPANPSQRAKDFPAPARFRPWSQAPTPGTRDEKAGVWTHELDFWGGRLADIPSRTEYLKSLGVDVVYLTPIFRALTNHKYDAQTYREIDPQLGTRDDLQHLTKQLHQSGMRLMLDGVFNHMGRTAPIFLEAQRDPKSPWREWFAFGSEHPAGYRAWYGVPNLPELNLENPAVRRELWEDRNSVVQSYLRQGISGWRLDVAFELGPDYLASLTQAARRARKDAWIVGEISGYPAAWFPAVDGVFNFTSLQLARRMMTGEVSGGRAGRILATMTEDAGIENLLRSWILVDNHDTARLASVVTDPGQRAFLFGLQFTLPGSPVIYYGTELGLTGAGDPMNRAPMPWDTATEANGDLTEVRRLAALRRAHPALRYGDFSVLETERLMAFLRTTDQVRQTVLVVANPTSSPVKETFSVREGRLLSWGQMRNVATGADLVVINGLASVEVAPLTVSVFAPVTRGANGMDPYKRIK